MYCLLPARDRFTALLKSKVSIEYKMKTFCILFVVLSLSQIILLRVDEGAIRVVYLKYVLRRYFRSYSRLRSYSCQRT